MAMSEKIVNPAAVLVLAIQEVRKGLDLKNIPDHLAQENHQHQLQAALPRIPLTPNSIRLI